MQENAIHTMPKIAVIGCGHWGKNLVRNFYELGNLYCVSDTNSILAQKFAKEYQVPSMTFEQIIADQSIDGVVIASPAEYHAPLAIKVLESGKHVYVEKPLALELKDAEDIIAAADKAGRQLMVGHLLQYHPAFLKIKDIVKSGKIGRLQYIYSNRLNLGKIRRAENVFWSFAPHDISMILSLAGELPTTVEGQGYNFLHKVISDVTMTHMSFANGVEAHIFVSWLHPFKEQRLVVVGSEGMLVFDDGLPWKEKVSLYPHKFDWQHGEPIPVKHTPEFITLEESEPLKDECQHFVDCVRENKTPRTDGREGLNVLKVMHATDESQKNKQSVSLKEIKKQEEFFAHETAIIDDGCSIGSGSKVWHFAHLLSGTTIGKNVSVGQNCMLGPKVTVGDNCKIQNNVSVYKGVTLEEGVFCGPSCVFTNVKNPRAAIERKDEFLETYVERGVTIGANATIVCGNRLGAYGLIAAGSVVTKDTKPHALMVGSPATQVGWVSHAGEKLDESLVCPRENRKYKINSEGFLEEVTESQQSKRKVA